MALPPDQLLHLGPDPAGASWNHFDLGLGLSSHINYPQAQLKNSPPQGAPWWYSKTNPTSGKDVVVFSAPLGGATTTTNTQYARCELREYERNGTTKMAFDPKDGDHWIEGKYRVFGLAGLDKPEVTMLQAHDGGDDVIMISTYQGGLRLRYNGSHVAVLDSSVSDGE
ncbi:MAG TPA: polysaccharide lyase family 7 protein, partial [Nitrososphaera sp.]|nr:polysaccharide lyase family 7 protein [Nitrososphaera sp.]